MEEQAPSIRDDQGFLADWYFALRASEEAARSERYQRPLTVIVVKVAPADRHRLERWFQDELRSTDLVCRGPSGDYFVLLVETDDTGAWDVGRRLLEHNATISFSMASLASDDSRFDALLYRLTESARKAQSIALPGDAYLRP
jgi:hypothetical protein